MKCEDCVFMLTSANGDTACRRNPPQITVMPVHSKVTGKGGLQIVSTYPPVGAEMPSCGEFKVILRQSEPGKN